MVMKFQNYDFFDNFLTILEILDLSSAYASRVVSVNALSVFQKFVVILCGDILPYKITGQCPCPIIYINEIVEIIRNTNYLQTRM